MKYYKNKLFTVRRMYFRNKQLEIGTKMAVIDPQNNLYCKIGEA